MRIYSIILTSFMMIISLIDVLKKDKRSERIASFIAFLLYVPMWLYLL